MPHSYSLSDAAGYSLLSSTAGHMHVQERSSMLIRKKSADSGNFMDVLQHILHRIKR